MQDKKHLRLSTKRKKRRLGIGLKRRLEEQRDKSVVVTTRRLNAKAQPLKRPLDTQRALASKQSNTPEQPIHTKRIMKKRKKSDVHKDEGVCEEQFSITIEESDLLTRVKEEPITDDDQVTVKTEVIPEMFETVLCETDYVRVKEEVTDDGEEHHEEDTMPGKDQQEILQLSISARFSNLLKRPLPVIMDCSGPAGLPVCTLDKDYSTSFVDGPICGKQIESETTCENQNTDELKYENPEMCELLCKEQEISNSNFQQVDICEIKLEDLEPSEGTSEHDVSKAINK